MIQIRKIGLLPLLMLLAAHSVSAQDTSPLLPTEVLHYSLIAMEENPGVPRLEAIGQYFERMSTSGLDENQRFALGEVYFLNFKPKKSMTAFEPFLEGRDLRARIAWQKTMQIKFAAFDQVEEVEAMLEEYRREFAPDDKDVHHADWQINNLAKLYQDRGDYEKAVALVTREIESLPKGTPFRSLRQPGLFMKSFEALGQADVAEKMLREARAAMDVAVAEYLQKHPQGILFYKPLTLKSGRYFRMEEGVAGRAFDADYPSPELRIHQFHLLSHEINFALWRIRTEKVEK